MQLTAAELRLIATVGVGVTTALLGFGLAAAPSREGSRLGLRGLKRQRAIEKSPIWAAVEPLVRWLGVRLSGLLSDRTRDKLDRQISLAGDALGLTAEEYVALMLLSAAGGVGAAVGLSSATDFSINLALILLTPIGAALPYLQISDAGQTRLVSIRRSLPFVIDLMAMAMSAGADFPGAVRQVVDKAPNPQDPIIEELTLLLQGLQIGRSRREVLEDFARRAPCDQVTEFTNAVIQAEQRGSPLAECLQVQAATYRTRRSVAAEEAASKASVKMTIPLLLVFISVLLLVMGPMLVKITSME